MQNQQHQGRRSPDGKDNEAFLLAEERKASVVVHNNNNNNTINSTKLGTDISTEIFSNASNDNGKINVQVTVLVGEFDLNSFVFFRYSVRFFFSLDPFS